MLLHHGPRELSVRTSVRWQSITNQLLQNKWKVEKSERKYESFGLQTIPSETPLPLTSFAEIFCGSFTPLDTPFSQILIAGQSVQARPRQLSRLLWCLLLLFGSGMTIK